jgi:pimeloyl-ACP methyl ester carboxylesterase
LKTFIENRDHKEVSVVVEGPKTPNKLAFVMHGLGGNKNQGHIRAMAEAFLESGYTVITFDTTNTFGESDGNYEDATITNYYADLEDVIEWASKQPWYSEPFVLSGHSLGGISTALFAEKYPTKVRALAPISTVVSGKLSLETNKLFPKESEDPVKWKRDGIRITKSHDGKIEKRLKWSHMEDRLKYDLLPKSNQLTMPVLMIVGSRDFRTPLIHQKVLFEKLPGKKEIHIINGALHSFYEPHEQIELKQLVKNWAENI